MASGLLNPERRRALVQGLLDTTQAASNSAASTVAAPVDAFAWALRKAGAPIPQAPFGGSDWMKAQGLMRDVQSPVANVVGESIGNVLPIVAAAKAPQIAAGLLKMGENAAARTPMNAATGKQAGAIVWHGSPHKFDKFDASKIGTGEGAQAYGHGLYLAESPDVAAGYQKALSGYAADGKRLPSDVATVVSNFNGDVAAAIAEKQGQLDKWLTTGADAKHFIVKGLRDDLKKLAGLQGKKLESTGALYKVDLPDDAIARMLDYDKPIKEQAGILESIRSSIPQDMLKSFDVNVEGGISGANAYKNWLWNGGKTEATKAEALRQAGIPGIRYLDGGSRGTGSGTSNFVVFPGNEGLLNILERNGQPLR